VYLVDDEPGVRRALTRLLRAEGYDVLSFASAESFLPAAEPDLGPACVVADLRMPGLSGLELQQALIERGLAVPVVLMSGQGDLASGVTAMKGGAVDFLEKPVSPERLLEAIGRALEQARRRRCESDEQAVLEARLAKLTPREREVFALVVTGRLNKQVGAELGASEKTIKVHRARVMEKMQAGSLAELVRMADKLVLRSAAHAPDAGPGRLEH
jgi:RNA polymerase sigma factor (sigma-70 family)